MLLLVQMLLLANGVPDVFVNSLLLEHLPRPVFSGWP